MKRKAVLLATTIVVLIIIVIIIIVANMPNDITTKIKKYCTNNDEISLSEVTRFDWDTAYIDYQAYGYGESIKEKYNLTGELQCLNSDYLYRIIFTKGNTIVSDELLSIHNVILEPSVEIVKPSTKFVVERKTESDGNKKVYLTKENP